MPDSWQCVDGKAGGGYGGQSKNGYKNKDRERIWFSPHCESERMAQKVLAL